MGIAHSPLSQNNGNLPLPFLVVITQVFSYIIFINDCIFLLTGSPGYIFLWSYMLYETFGVTRIIQF